MYVLPASAQAAGRHEKVFPIKKPTCGRKYCHICEGNYIYGSIFGKKVWSIHFQCLLYKSHNKIPILERVMNVLDDRNGEQKEYLLHMPEKMANGIEKLVSNLLNELKLNLFSTLCAKSY
ncbi:MAG: hypothetical protein K1W41_25005 [Lachnospiraceae bacterium]